MNNAGIYLLKQTLPIQLYKFKNSPKICPPKFSDDPFLLYEIERKELNKQYKCEV